MVCNFFLSCLYCESLDYSVIYYEESSAARFQCIGTYNYVHFCCSVCGVYTVTYGPTSTCCNNSVAIIFPIIRVYKSHLKMVQGCTINTGPCKKDSPKTLGTRVSCKTGTGLDGQRARQA